MSRQVDLEWRRHQVDLAENALRKAARTFARVEREGQATAAIFFMGELRRAAGHYAAQLLLWEDMSAD